MKREQIHLSLGETPKGLICDTVTMENYAKVGYRCSHGMQGKKILGLYKTYGLFSGECRGLHNLWDVYAKDQ